MFTTKMKIALASALVLVSFTAGVRSALSQGLQVQNEDKRQLPDAKQAVEELERINASGQIPPLADLPEDLRKSLFAAIKGSDKMKSLLKDQYQAARAEALGRWQEFLAGRGTLDFLFGACQRLLQAEFDLSNKRADRIAALEAQLQRMQAIEMTNKARYRAGRINMSDFEGSRFQRLRAEIMLERAKAGRIQAELMD
jgi:hypothetical protein